MRRHLTYANVMATIAIFVAIGGGAYAAATIDSGDVVNDSLKSADLMDDKGVKGDDVKADSLEGVDVDEASLGEVPDASEVNNVTAAGFRYARDIDAAPANETVFQLGDFEMQARCGETTPGNASLIIDTISHKNNASLSAATPDGQTVDIENDMDDGELEVLSGDAYSDGNGPNTLVYVSPNSGLGVGLDGGDVVTAQFMADENDALAGRECVIAGIAFQRDMPPAAVIP